MYVKVKVEGIYFIAKYTKWSINCIALILGKYILCQVCFLTYDTGVPKIVPINVKLSNAMYMQ